MTEIENEIWKDIEGYEGFYQVSSLGRVKSLERIDCLGHHRKERIMKQSLNIDGYPIVCFHINSKKINHRVNRLVAKAFLPNPNNLPEVNHKDEVKTNNRVDNLEWCTGQYNSEYSNAIPINQYTKEGVFIRQWKSTAEFANYIEKPKARSHLTECCQGKLKSAYGFIWRYA